MFRRGKPLDAPGKEALAAGRLEEATVPDKHLDLLLGDVEPPHHVVPAHELRHGLGGEVANEGDVWVWEGLPLGQVRQLRLHHQVRAPPKKLVQLQPQVRLLASIPQAGTAHCEAQRALLPSRRVRWKSDDWT